MGLLSVESKKNLNQAKLPSNNNSFSSELFQSSTFQLIQTENSQGVTYIRFPLPNQYYAFFGTCLLLLRAIFFKGEKILIPRKSLPLFLKGEEQFNEIYIQSQYFISSSSCIPDALPLQKLIFQSLCGCCMLQHNGLFSIVPPLCNSSLLFLTRD